ncbi:MAG TPA: hypothetical protein VMH83_12060 [Candidatus Acidoferrum sp.]|jgi:hypothetical protein|nr:hypothetical protein [Candidatus Acidoferrum sp.]
MRTTLLTALAAAAILSGGFFADNASAFTLAAPSALAATPALLVQRVANVCGPTGCVPVQTKKVRHFKNGSAVGQHI